MREKKVSSNTFSYETMVSRNDREKLNQHRSVVIWLTGFSGSGKSTIAQLVEQRLHQYRCRTIILDGDNIRHGLCGDLGFCDSDRAENIRRISELSKIFLEAGTIVLAAFITPLTVHRSLARDIIGHCDFIEVFCDCSMEVCESRDIKGLYKKARKGVIKEFTGISAPYEQPKAPDLVLRTDVWRPEECVNEVISLLQEKNIIMLPIEN